jgi:hypothetical protein
MLCIYILEIDSFRHQIARNQARLQTIAKDIQDKKRKYEQYLKSMESKQAKQTQAIVAAQEKLENMKRQQRELEVNYMYIYICIYLSDHPVFYVFYVSICFKIENASKHVSKLVLCLHYIYIALLSSS